MTSALLRRAYLSATTTQGPAATTTTFTAFTTTLRHSQMSRLFAHSSSSSGPSSSAPLGDDDDSTPSGIDDGVVISIADIEVAAAAEAAAAAATAKHASVDNMSSSSLPGDHRMYMLYHNAKCSKSRATHALLKQHGVAPLFVVNYLELRLDRHALMEILVALKHARGVDEHDDDDDVTVRLMYRGDTSTLDVANSIAEFTNLQEPEQELSSESPSAVDAALPPLSALECAILLDIEADPSLLQRPILAQTDSKMNLTTAVLGRPTTSGVLQFLHEHGLLEENEKNVE